MFYKEAWRLKADSITEERSVVLILLLFNPWDDGKSE
jgi:hypothetical protein